MESTVARALDTNRANLRLGNSSEVTGSATFVTSTDSPDIYDANHVTDIRASSAAEIDGVLEDAERAYQHTGHRRFDVDFRTPPEFIARLVLDGGYTRDDTLFLILDADLIGDATPHDIRPLGPDSDWEAMWELLLVDWHEHSARTGRPAVGEGVTRQMWRAKRRKQPPTQYWLAYVKGRPVGYFNSWEGVNGVGQVEDLFVLPDFRHRGVATALIHHCVSESRKGGAGPIVIAADPGDTPKNMYAGMGFRPVASSQGYLKRLSTS